MASSVTIVKYRPQLRVLYIGCMRSSSATETLLILGPLPIPVEP